MYSFHIEFTNGSNSFYSFPCNFRQHTVQLRKWKLHYNLEVLTRFGNTTYYKATEKHPPVPQVNLFRTGTVAE